ncbi:hypothetical protein Sjap_009820 [Stephania japonica]|uniref:GDSL esterase/lipase n=1 Tax=Stephania japonica TaxID=461633 RepID=A0AAP0JAK3_9MAGN
MSSLVLILVISLSALSFTNAAGDPALFIFGDSIIDIGTNNGLDTTFKANIPPYGIDFPDSVATGRFSNGFSAADFLAQKLGLERSPPPYLAIANHSAYLNRQMVSGLNFASGGAGLLDDTGYGNAVTIKEQIQQFQMIKANLTALLGEAGAERLLNKSIIFINAGSIDMALDYFSFKSPPTTEFSTSLRDALEDHVKTLYSFGARKFGIAGVSAIGCCPAMRAGNDTGECSADLNDYPQSFYSAIVPMLQNLSSELTGMKYSLGNVYHMMMNYLNNPSPSGPTELRRACCRGGKLNAELQCNEKALVCKNRDKYLFWDAFHPSQAAAAIAVETLYNGTTEFVTPINLKQLIEEY